MSISSRKISLVLACGLLTSTSAVALDRASLHLAQAGPDDLDQRGGRGKDDAGPPPGVKEKAPPAERGEGRRARDGGGDDGDAPAKKRPSPAAGDDDGPPPKAERAPRKDSDDDGPPRTKRDDGAPPKKLPEKVVPKAAPSLDGDEPPAKKAPAPVPKAEPKDLKPEPKDVPQRKDAAPEPKDVKPAPVPKAEPKDATPAPKDLKPEAAPKSEPKLEPKAKDDLKAPSDAPKAPSDAPKATEPPADKKRPTDKQGRPAQPAPGAPAPAADGKQPEAAPSEVKDLKELKEERKERSEDGGKRVIIEEPDKRAIIKEEGRVIIRHDETERFRRLDKGNFRREKRNGLDISISVRPGGIEIYTETDDRGRPLRRYRRDRDGREVILFDNRDFYRRHNDGSFVDAIIELPPPRVSIPRERYIVDYEEATDVEVYEALSAPPVEEIDRAYSLEEVRRSPMLRDRMRRVDLDAINFEFGAWEVASDQYPALERVAKAMRRVIDRNPEEMFLVEGHTDAVGSDEDNLSLSDRRAESVSIILTEEFGVPAENMTTQGYGEQYLKVTTDAAERENRRVAVRRITPLLSRK